MAGGARPGPGPRRRVAGRPGPQHVGPGRRRAARVAAGARRRPRSTPRPSTSCCPWSPSCPRTARTGLLVGHNPGLEELVEHLVGEPVRAADLGAGPGRRTRAVVGRRSRAPAGSGRVAARRAVSSRAGRGVARTPGAGGVSGAWTRPRASPPSWPMRRARCRAGRAPRRRSTRSSPSPPSSSDGCDLVGISVVHRGGIDTPAASDEPLRRVDELQFELKEGPCYDALRTHETVCSRDLAT